MRQIIVQINVPNANHVPTVEFFTTPGCMTPITSKNVMVLEGQAVRGAVGVKLTDTPHFNLGLEAQVLYKVYRKTRLLLIIYAILIHFWQMIFLM